MEVICINDKGIDPRIVNQPKEGTVYEVRKVVYNGVTLGLSPKKGYLLKEIVNSEIEHPSGLGKFEPNFSIERFAMLSSPQMVRESVADEVLV